MILLDTCGINMEFCNKCGSRMIRMKTGFLCPKCHYMLRLSHEGSLKKAKKGNSSQIYVYSGSEDTSMKVTRPCPACGNMNAYRWTSGISGEHAGIRQERTIEHFKCIRCSHSWTEES